MKDNKKNLLIKNKTPVINRKSCNGEDDSNTRYKDFLKKEKMIDTEVYLQNLEKISNSRFYSAVLAGIFSGTFCLTGLYGIAFYFINCIIFSLFLSVYMQFRKGTFLLSPTNVFTTGVFTHLMVFVIFWVMFYNLVHIY